MYTNLVGFCFSTGSDLYCASRRCRRVASTFVTVRRRRRRRLLRLARVDPICCCRVSVIYLLGLQFGKRESAVLGVTGEHVRAPCPAWRDISRYPRDQALRCHTGIYSRGFWFDWFDALVGVPHLLLLLLPIAAAAGSGRRLKTRAPTKR